MTSRTGRITEATPPNIDAANSRTRPDYSHLQAADLMPPVHGRYCHTAEATTNGQPIRPAYGAAGDTPPLANSRHGRHYTKRYAHYRFRVPPNTFLTYTITPNTPTLVENTRNRVRYISEYGLAAGKPHRQIAAAAQAGVMLPIGTAMIAAASHLRSHGSEITDESRHVTDASIASHSQPDVLAPPIAEGQHERSRG